MGRFPANEIMSLVAAAPRYDLAESLGPDLLLGEIVDAAELAGLRLGYGTAPGDPKLRRLIAQAHGVTADEVVITMGGMHALFLTAFILCGRDGEAVITAPAFPPARDCLEAVGATVKILSLSFARRYQPDPASLRALLSPNTRLVSLASPQNPSGVAIPAKTLRAILAAMADVCPQACLLVDETYREAAYGNDAIAPSALALSPKVVSIASLSKCHGAPGLRLGWAITRDASLREQLVRGKFNTVISCSPVDEALAVGVLAARERVLAERRRRLAKGLARTAAWIGTNGALVEWVRPDAAALCCVRLKPDVFDDEAVARFYSALGENDVRVACGSWFGDEARVFRLGFGLPAPAELDAGLAALSAALRQAAPAVAP
jgi:aspartate/methionine/tyrosine aminotransferase